jgi:hypothetical protein
MLLAKEDRVFKEFPLRRETCLSYVLDKIRIEMS